MDRSLGCFWQLLIDLVAYNRLDGWRGIGCDAFWGKVNLLLKVRWKEESNKVMVMANSLSLGPLRIF